MLKTVNKISPKNKICINEDFRKNVRLSKYLYNSSKYL